jgi:ABC-2 type transport system permease protein
MKPKNRFTKTTVYIAGIIAGAILLSLKFIRIDLTSEGRYTLSDFTVSLLESLDDKVYVKVYLEGEGLPVTLKRYKREIKEELDEFKAFAGDNIVYEFIDPAESKDKEVRFAFYKSLTEKGLLPIETTEISDDGKTSQKMVFPGAGISYKGKETIVNLLKTTGGLAPESEENVNNSIQSLEYELTNAIQKLSKKSKPEIAFINGHGELNEYEVMDISTALSEYYTVKTGKIGGQAGILDGFKAVIIANPQEPFSEEDKFVIDQYIMKGGNLLCLIDGVRTDIDSLFITGSTMALAQDLNLNDLLFEYGVRINNNLLQDLFSSPIGLSTKASDGSTKINHYPWYFFPVLVSENNHVISKYLNYVRTEFTSTLDTVGLDPDVKKTILLRSSQDTRLEPIPAKISLDMINLLPPDNQMKSGKKNIAVLLEGKFTSVFKNRPVEKYFPELSGADIRTKSKPAKIIVISDGDIIRNEVTSDGRPYPIGFDRFTRQTFTGNGELILNAVNYLCDDEGLMTIRSREIKMRLLNRELIAEHKLLIKSLNVVLPLIPILLLGFLVSFVRKRKYQSNTKPLTKE